MTCVLSVGMFGQDISGKNSGLHGLLVNISDKCMICVSRLAVFPNSFIHSPKYVQFCYVNIIEQFNQISNS